MKATEWNFSSVTKQDEPSACGYEYLRELSEIEFRKPWLELSKKERAKSHGFRRMAEGRTTARAIRILSREEAEDWLEWLDNPTAYAGKAVSMMVNLGAYSDTELLEAFRVELPRLRELHSQPSPQRKGKRTISFRAHLDNLSLMRLRHEMPIEEIFKLLKSDAPHIVNLHGPLSKVREAIDERRKRCVRHFSELYPSGGKPIHWQTFLERGKA